MRRQGCSGSGRRAAAPGGVIELQEAGGTCHARRDGEGGRTGGITHDDAPLASVSSPTLYFHHPMRWPNTDPNVPMQTLASLAPAGTVARPAALANPPLPDHYQLARCHG